MNIHGKEFTPREENLLIFGLVSFGFAIFFAAMLAIIIYNNRQILTTKTDDCYYVEVIVRGNQFDEIYAGYMEKSDFDDWLRGDAFAVTVKDADGASGSLIKSEVIYKINVYKDNKIPLGDL